MKSEHRILLSEFTSRVRSRLDKGGGEYREKNLDAGCDEGLDLTVREILEEAEDVAGWSFILWSKIRGLRAKIEMLEGEYGRLKTEKNALERTLTDEAASTEPAITE